jgi:AraC-like DNA-binding protein
MSNPAPEPASLPPLTRARVVGAYAQTAVDTARELGADLQRLGSDCGLPALPRGLPDSVTVPQYIGLLDAAARQLDAPLFGLQVGQRMRLSTFASYGLVLCTCTDFRAVAAQTLRFECLAHDLGRSELVEQDGIAHYRWHSPWLTLPGARHLSESVMAGIRGFANWLASGELPVLAVAFTHPALPDVTADDYVQLFGAPVRFGADVTQASFPAEVLDTRVSNADTSLFDALARTAEQRLAARQHEAQDAPIVAAVRERIRAQLMHGRAQLPQIAQALGLSARTLQRRLGAQDSSFTGLLDTTRRELAEQYLRDPRLSLTEIAFLLGFGQQSDFNHAFRSWFDTAPAAWRATHAAAPPPAGGARGDL